MKVEKFEFTSFSDKIETFKDLSESDFSQHKSNIDLVEQEVNVAGFQVDERVQKLSGYLDKQGHKIDEEVRNRVQIELEKIKKQAYDEGVEAGKVVGLQKYEESVEDHVKKLVEELDEFMSQLKSREKNYWKEYEQSLLDVLRLICRWALTNESSYNQYLPAILEKMISEMNAKRNLKIRLNRKSFSLADEILEQVQDKIGILENVQVECIDSNDSIGVILESDQGILDSSLESLLNLVDRIFESSVENNE